MRGKRPCGGSGRSDFLTATIATLASVAPASSQTPHRGGTLQVAITAEPNTTDCHAGGTFAVVQHLAPHYSTLLKFDGNDYPNIVGDLAESWTAGEDGKVFTFKIRRNVKFHDGSALTSKDVAATFERLRNPPDGIRVAAQTDVRRHRRDRDARRTRRWWCG